MKNVIQLVRDTRLDLCEEGAKGIEDPVAHSLWPLVSGFKFDPTWNQELET
jgi:hypothetical protein